MILIEREREDGSFIFMLILFYLYDRLALKSIGRS